MPGHPGQLSSEDLVRHSAPARVGEADGGGLQRGRGYLTRAPYYRPTAGSYERTGSRVILGQRKGMLC